MLLLFILINNLSCLCAYNKSPNNLDFFKNSEVKILDEKNLLKVIEKISGEDINSVLVEAGPKLVQGFLENGLCDQLIVYQSPDKLGENGVSWFEGGRAIDKYGLSLKSSFTIDRDKKSVFEK